MKDFIALTGDEARMLIAARLRAMADKITNWGSDNLMMRVDAENELHRIRGFCSSLPADWNDDQ